MKPPAIETLLASYPRTRPPLSVSQQAHYEEHYRRNRAGQTGLFKITAALESWMHRTVAAAPAGTAVLELGAGNLNHVPYEKQVAVYDAVEPMTVLWRESANRSLIRRIYGDISAIEPGRSYDRIISVAVLEHLTELPHIIARCGMLLRPGGRFQAGIPSEGGLLWGLGWRTTTALAYRLRHGEDYGRLMRHEHVNTAREVEAVLGYFFERVALRRFPLPGLHWSFYTYFEAEHPRTGQCKEFAAGLGQRERPS